MVAWNRPHVLCLQKTGIKVASSSFFCSTPAEPFFRPQISRAVVSSGSQGRRFFSAAEGLKHLFHGILHFLHPSFFVRLGIPFLRPDPHVLDAGARRGCQGRPLLCLASRSVVSRPRLDRPEHGGTLVVVGMTRPRGARCRGTRGSRRNLVSGGS
jgi:hypothetical protein